MAGGPYLPVRPLIVVIAESSLILAFVTAVCCHCHSVVIIITAITVVQRSDTKYYFARLFNPVADLSGSSLEHTNLPATGTGLNLNGDSLSVLQDRHSKWKLSPKTNPTKYIGTKRCEFKNTAIVPSFFASCGLGTFFLA